MMARGMAHILDCLELSCGTIRPHLIQIGANDGRLADPVYGRLSQRGWSGDLFEPSPIYFPRLEQTYAQTPDVTLHNLGISDKASELELHHLAPDHEQAFPDWVKGCASLEKGKIEAAILKVRPLRPGDIVSVHVPVERLDRALSPDRLSACDMMVIDVEGHELQVLGSFDIKVVDPTIMLIEHSQLSVEKFAEMRELLKDQGYRLFSIGADTLAMARDWIGPTLPWILSLCHIHEIEPD